MMTELRELREECKRFGYRYWRRASELRLLRFKLREKTKKTSTNKTSLRTCSWDFETCEPLLPEQRQFAWHEKNNVFYFEPKQLMQHFLSTGQFTNPFTRSVISDRHLRRLCQLCKDMTFAFWGERRCVTPDLVVPLREAISEHARVRDLLQNLVTETWQAVMIETSQTPGLRQDLQDWMLQLVNHDKAAYTSTMQECLAKLAEARNIPLSLVLDACLQ